VSFVTIDTDVASAIIRGRPPATLEARLAGRDLAVTFVTVGELTKWVQLRSWGLGRLAALSEFYERVVVLPYSVRVAHRWGELQAAAVQRGRPRPANDTWIAACCLSYDLPLATLNHKDFVDYTHHEALRFF
jgi:predicted nucleic acid-binding protein